MTWFDTGGNTPPHEPHAAGSRAENERKVWNGIEGRTLSAAPFPIAEGFVRFRPDGGPYDFIVPEGEVDDA